MVKVFYYKFDNQFNFSISDVKNRERKSYLESINDKKRQKQSLVVWLLLERILNNYYPNINVDLLTCDNGKWYIKSNEIFFSLSHTENSVVVALSANPVGVDIEFASNKIIKSKNYISRLKQFLKEKKIGNEAIFLTNVWTKSEAIYKLSLNEGYFSNKIIDYINDKPLVLSVCSNKDIKVEINRVNTIKVKGDNL